LLFRLVEIVWYWN